MVTLAYPNLRREQYTEKKMIECTRYKSHKKGCLQGFADFYLPKWGVEIMGFSLYMKDGKRWMKMPSKEYENELGEKKFAPVIRFRDNDHMDAFSNEAKKAIDKWCKENAPKEEVAVPDFDDSRCPF